jgi:hypothetical protein
MLSQGVNGYTDFLARLQIRGAGVHPCSGFHYAGRNLSNVSFLPTRGTRRKAPRTAPRENSSVARASWLFGGVAKKDPGAGFATHAQADQSARSAGGDAAGGIAGPKQVSADSSWSGERH